MRKVKVRKADLRIIPIGSSATFYLEHPREIDIVRSLASQINKTEPELGINLRCAGDYDARKVTVFAEKVEQ